MSYFQRHKSSIPPPFRALRESVQLLPETCSGSMGKTKLPATCFHEILMERARRQADQRAFTYLVDGDREEVSITYGELDRRARAIAALLQSFVSPGERALLIYPPGLDFLTGLFGCLYAGVVAVPAYSPDPLRLDRTLPRLQAILADSQASVVLTTAPILALAEVLFSQAPDLGALQWMATNTAASGLEYGWQDPVLNESSPALLQYTSGSTRAPHGVMVTHSNLLYNSWLIGHALKVRPACSSVIWLPPYHDMGLIGGILVPVAQGIHCTLMSPLSFLQHPARWLQAISRQQATISGGPNFAYELCLRKVTREEMEDLDLSTWRVAFNGSEPLRADTMERFSRVFAPCGFRSQAFYPCYGLAEATLFVSGGVPWRNQTIAHVDPASLEKDTVSPARGISVAKQMVSSGLILGAQQILIVDPETRMRCPEGKVGEIWVAGPGVAAGYWNKAQENLEIFFAYLRDTREGPFLRTGDLGFMQAGELYVTGRIQDSLLMDGRRLYPTDIEASVEACHANLRPGGCAAFSIEVEGQAKLVILAEYEGGLEEAGGMEGLRQEISRVVEEQHRLQVYDLLLLQPRSLLKTANGKLQRQACKEDYLNRRFEERKLLAPQVEAPPSSPLPEPEPETALQAAVKS